MLNTIKNPNNNVIGRTVNFLVLIKEKRNPLFVFFTFSKKEKVISRVKTSLRTEFPGSIFPPPCTVCLYSLYLAV